MEPKKSDIWTLVANGYQALRNAYRETRNAMMRASEENPEGMKANPRTQEMRHYEEYFEEYETEFVMAYEILAEHSVLAVAMADEIIMDYIEQYERSSAIDREIYGLLASRILAFAGLGASRPALEKLLPVFESLEATEAAEELRILLNAN